MIHNVGDLLGEQPNVQRVQYPSRTWSREVELKVPGGIPRECGDSAIGTDSKIIKHATQTSGAFGPLAIRLALNASCSRSHDFFRRE
jgi:hypothetical protein